MIKVLFICRANICRSPTAHAVLEQLIARRGLENKIEVCSAGTNAPYPGRVPDQRAQSVARANGYDMSGLNATQLTSAMASESDYLIIMDDHNYSDASEILAEEETSRLRLLLSFSDVDDLQLRDPFFSGSGGGHGFIPDPIDSGERAFTAILKKIEVACESLLDEICEQARI